MRILIISHPPLSAEFGAAQIALSLAGALCARGHDALAWSPEPLPGATHWWNHWRLQRETIERFVAEQEPFDVIDAPAISASSELARRGRLVVRSIQPELLYIFYELKGDLLRRGFPSYRVVPHALVDSRRVAAILAGWRRAHRILCMGRLEQAWMTRWFPFWASKLGCYLCAPSAADRRALAEVRRRRSRSARRATRFLWIGRWASHKGTSRLLHFIRRQAVANPADTFTLAGCGTGVESHCPPEWLRSGRVRIVPSFSRAELPSLLAGHDAGLFTSSAEGWALSLNEMLESGLPVFATEAGAVADLRPFFPHSLHSFPPPAHFEPPAQVEDLATNGYYRRFEWNEIARSYEKQVLEGAPADGLAVGQHEGGVT